MVLVKNLKNQTFIQSYLSNRIQRVKINLSFSDYNNVELDITQGSVCESLFFNIFICDLFFDDVDIYLVNYANDTSPYAYDLENEKVIKLLEKNIDKLFDWFSDNILNANPDNCHLLLKTD